jgi:sulfur-oxidizing protein SoxZ
MWWLKRKMKMAKVKPRAKIPKEAEINEIIEIKTLIRHPMHSGRNKDSEGKTIPRLIINRFEARFEGQVVFTMNLEPSISSNPYISFPFKVFKSGKFELKWTEDGGNVYKLSKSMKAS